MIKKPKPIRHMVLWGALAGQILGVLFIMGFLGIVARNEFNLINLLWILISPFSWMLAFQFGLLPGVIMGLVDGLLLKKLIDDNETFSRQKMKTQRLSVYGNMFTSTLIMTLVLIGVTFGTLSFLIIPAFIAASAATYAAHRYMFRLRLWNEQQGIGKSKTKRKNDDLTASRLVEQSPDEQQQMTYNQASTYKEQGQ